MAGTACWVCAGAGACGVLLKIPVGKFFTQLHMQPGRAPASRAPFFTKIPPPKNPSGKGPAGYGLFLCTCFFMALALGLYVFNWQSQAAPALIWAGRKGEVRARVLDYPEERYRQYYYRLRVERVDGEEVRAFTLWLSAGQPLYCQPYDLVECTVVFGQFQDGGLYSRRNTRLAAGCQMDGYLSGAGGRRVAHTGFALGEWLARWRRGLYREFSKLLPGEEAGLLQAMVLGRRDSLSEEAYGDFRLVGCAHLLVVSGLHMGAAAMLLTGLFRRLGLGRVPRNLLAAGCLLVFLCATGFPVSAARACVMYVTYLLAGCLGRRADGVNSLGLALLAVCLQDPFSGGDLGLALSAFATLGILTLQKGLEAALLRPLEGFPRVKGAAKPAAAGLAVTFSAMAFTAPFQLAAFGGFSLLSPVANLLLAAPCTVLLYCGLFMAAFSALPFLAGLAQPFAFCAGWAARAALWIARALADVPQAYRHLRPHWLCAMGFVFLLLALACLPGWVRARAAALLCAAALVLSCAVWEGFYTQGEVVVAVAGEGAGACVVVVKGGHGAVLRAGERSGTAVSLLRQNNVRQVDALFLEGSSSGERQSAREVLAAYPVGQVVLPQGVHAGDDLSPARTGVGTGVAAPGGSVRILPGVEAEFLLDGGRMAFTSNGKRFIVEWEPSGGGLCDYLVTTEKASAVNSSFTVLLADGIIEEKLDGEFWQGVPGGAYYAPGEDGLRLEILPDGRVSVREGG